MQHLRFVKLMACVIFTIAMPAMATTYNCTAVDKKASLGIGGSASVSMTTGDKSCQFSVNGESINGDTTKSFRMELNRLLGMDPWSSSAFGKQDMKSLQLLIMGPNFIGGSVGFDNSFRNVADDVGQCLKSRGQRSVEDNYRGILCKAFSPADLKQKSFGFVSVSSDEAILVLSATIDRQTYTLFVPFSLLKAGEQGFRFR